MKVTDVRIKRIETEKLKAVASVTFDEVFVVHDIKIIDGDKGLFVAMPSRKIDDGVYIDIAHPLNSDFRGYVVEEIMNAYNS
jgi:stage V sporulation protein G